MEGSGKLVAFMKTLLNHAADAVRVPEVVVDSSLDDLRLYHETVHATEAYLSERYNDNHGYPRLEFERRVEDHIASKKTMYEQYLATKSKTALFEYVTTKPPMKADAAAIEIYTRYV